MLIVMMNSNFLILLKNQETSVTIHTSVSWLNSSDFFGHSVVIFQKETFSGTIRNIRGLP